MATDIVIPNFKIKACPVVIIIVFQRMIYVGIGYSLVEFWIRCKLPPMLVSYHYRCTARKHEHGRFVKTRFNSFQY